MQNFIKDDAQRPHINGIGVIMKLGLLGCDVLLRASDCLHDDLLGTESKISQFDKGKWLPTNVLGLEEYILGLEIAMGDAVVMQFLYSLADLQDAL